MSPAACIAAPLPTALFLTELRRQCTQLFNCEGNPLRAARSIERTVTAILPQRLPSCCCGICIFVVPENTKSKCASGRIAVTVRPIACARVGRQAAPPVQLGALSPQFGAMIAAVGATALRLAIEHGFRIGCAVRNDDISGGLCGEQWLTSIMNASHVRHSGRRSRSGIQ